MEHTPHVSKEPSVTDSRLEFIKEGYGEENTAELLAIFSSRNPELSHEEVVKAVYDIDVADLPRSTSWPDTTLDQILTFR